MPIKEPVAGISSGLVVDEENPDKYVTFIDIQGIEDFLVTWISKSQEPERYCSHSVT